MYTINCICSSKTKTSRYHRSPETGDLRIDLKKCGIIDPHLVFFNVETNASFRWFSIPVIFHGLSITICGIFRWFTYKTYNTWILWWWFSMAMSVYWMVILDNRELRIHRDSAHWSPKDTIHHWDLSLFIIIGKKSLHRDNDISVIFTYFILSWI